MAERLLVDTGPIVAILNPRDTMHAVCVAESRKRRGQFLTCWPVITEAAWLLRMYPASIARLYAAIHDGTLELLPLERGCGGWLADFTRRYQSITPQLADAALSYLAEREQVETVFTLDRRDFSIYRLAGGKAMRIVPIET